ncbi:unnamed protein product [Lymnaea stagnalis]|uniref:Uncharacterized protein n=1 Tax=Lymnaea stagnalis TaxID=6523 RepID=A0AAV2I8F9_LYMST
MATGILVQSHSACVWDVCFSPFYEVLASCDATGKVKVTLPQMVGLRTKTIKSQISWHTRTCPSMVLYQARLAEETPAGQGPSANVTQQCEGHLQNTESVIPGQGHEPDLSSETESNQPANHINKEEFQLSTLTNNLHLENSKNLNKTETNQILTGHTKPTSAKKSGSSTKVPGLACSESCPNSEDTLHYVETRPELKLSAKVSGKVEHEVYGGSNIQAVHRVRFSPNVNCCLWLASGGEAGILRLHNLTSVVRPSKAKAHQFYEKHRKGKNS